MSGARQARETRRVLITGATTGIGRSLALQMARRGDRVVICGRRADLLEDVLRQENAITATSCDVTDQDDRNRLAATVQTALGGLDLLVNNAGVQFAHAYGRGVVPASEVEREVAVNLVAPMLLTHQFLPLLMRGRSPAIANIASLLAVTPKPGSPGYCASKAGLLTFTRALRMQLQGTPVRVVEVFPPLVDTPMTAGRGAGAKMSADEFAAHLIRGLDGGRERIAVGDARAVLLFSRSLPGVAEWMIRRMTRPDAPPKAPPNNSEKVSL